MRIQSNDTKTSETTETNQIETEMCRNKIRRDGFYYRFSAVNSYYDFKLLHQI